SQPGPVGRAGRRIDKRCAEGAFGLFGFLPIAVTDVVAVHPDLTDGSLRALGTGPGVDDAHRRRLRHAVTDQRYTVSGSAPPRLAGGQFLGFEKHGFRWLTRFAGRHVERGFGEPIRGA